MRQPVRMRVWNSGERNELLFGECECLLVHTHNQQSSNHLWSATKGVRHTALSLIWHTRGSIGSSKGHEEFGIGYDRAPLLAYAEARGNTPSR